MVPYAHLRRQQAKRRTFKESKGAGRLINVPSELPAPTGGKQPQPTLYRIERN